MARGVHSRAQTYEARVTNLERDIISQDATIVKLRWAVNEIEQGRVDFELNLYREKAELL